MASDYTQIVKLYTDAEKQLLAAVEKAPTSGTSKAYMQRLLKRVQKVLKELRADSSRLNSEVVKQAYYDGIKDVQRAISKGPGLSVELHDFDSAADALAEETDAYYRKAIAATGRRINDEIRESLSAATEKKFSEWQTIQEMRRDLLKSLQDTTSPAVIGVETRNGRVIPLKSYASMAARTSVAEAQNRAKVMYCLQSDIDLLKCSKHTPTCEICSQYQDRVYALTKEAAAGKYKGPNGEPLRFPYIYDTAFVDGYETIHPNCRHRMLPFVAEAYTPEELAEYSRQSMQPFADVRSDAERKAYQVSQVKNNRRRADMKQYLRYKERLGEDKVPKTFAAFRSIKSKNGDAWDRLQSEYRKHAENVTSDDSMVKHLKAADESDILKQGLDRLRFSTILRSESEMTREYSRELRDRFALGTDHGQRAFSRYVPNGSVADPKYTGKGHYSPIDGKIYMNYADDSNNPRGIGATFFHEHGHLIDHRAGDPRTGAYLSESISGFRTALFRDFDDTVQSIIVEHERSTHLPCSDQTAFSILCGIFHDDDRAHAVSDLYDGISGGTVYGEWVHDRGYWSAPHRFEHEAFAHMYQAQFDAHADRLMERYFPSSYALFKSALSKAVK